MNMNSATENIVIAAELKLRLEKPDRICLEKSAVLGLTQDCPLKSAC